MKTISWEKIKEKAQYEMYEAVDRTDVGKLALLSLADMKEANKLPTAQHEKRINNELKDEGEKIINNWDIRDYKSLMEIFPKAFPTWIRNGNVKIDYDGEWNFYETETTEEFKTGGLSSFWNSTKKHASTAFAKTKHVSKTAYNKTKKAVKDKIHDTKKNIALEVLDSTKDKVDEIKNKDDRNKYMMTLKGAENLVEAKYGKGGTTKSGWNRFVEWLNEPF